VTLLKAVESLALMEVNAVSWINVIPIHTGGYLAIFTIAFVLPFLEFGLPDEFRSGQPRFWPNQKRLLESDIPIQEQIRELHNTQALGNLEHVYLRPRDGRERGLWTIKPHAGSGKERMTWMERVIVLEGRTPVLDVMNGL
jgi:hypothetical protein